MMYGFIAGMMIVFGGFAFAVVNMVTGGSFRAHGLAMIVMAFGGLVALVCGVFGAWAIVQRYL